VALDRDEAHHLIRVRRLGIGAEAVLFDGRATAVPARVVAIGRDRVELEIVGEPLADRIAVIPITLATAVPKGDRFDWLIEKATELGIVRLVPLIAERSVANPRATKLDRLRQKVVEASKQCGRNTLMELAPPVAWLELVARAAVGVRYVADPAGPSWGVMHPPARGEAAMLAIGPEGGFTELEVAAAVTAGWRSVALGSTILRIETAALAGCAALLALGDYSAIAAPAAPVKRLD
jgi:16S rRNA (uracil1498-N3)-methyltransferase